MRVRRFSIRQMNLVNRALGILCTGAILLLHQGVHAEGLLDVYILAQEKDPQLGGVDAARQATLEARPQARAQLLPSLSLSANIARNFQEITAADAATLARFQAVPQTFGRVSFTSGSYTLSITQPVFHYDYWEQLKQADSRIQQATLEVDATRQDLMLRVTERYFGVLAAIDNLEFSR